MSQEFQVKGLSELLQRMTAFPVELTKSVAITMAASLNTFWENVPPYPQQDPQSKYRRTGTLGRSLGSDVGGGASGGKPGIYNIRKLGEANFQGEFGTNLEYAEYVIGEGTQAGMHSSNWWTIKTVAERAADKVERLWEALGEKLAQFLESKGQ